MKKPIHIHIEKLFDKIEITNLTPAADSLKIEQSLLSYQEKLEEFTKIHEPKLSGSSAYENKLGLERDLDILWESFRRLEHFIQACNLHGSENKNYESYGVELSRDPKHMFPRPQR